MKTIALSILLSLGTTLPHGATAIGAEPLPASVAKFADAYTVGAARIDLGSFQPQAWTEAILAAAPDQNESLAGPLEEFTQGAQGWLDAFREAGGREVYALVSLSYLGMEPPVLLVAPVAETGNPANLEALLTPMLGEIKAECRVIDRCVVAAPASVWKIRETTPLRPASPNLSAAFDASGAGLIQVAFAPYAESARVLEEMMPRLPAVVGGGSVTALTRGLQWANLSLQGPPQVGINLMVQSEDAKSATELREVCERGLKAFGTIPDVREHLPAWPSLQAALTPTAEGNALRLQLSQQQLTTIARQILVPALTDARQKATRIMVLNQLKQIALGLILYAEDHSGQLPEHLADILPYLGGTATVLLLPQSAVEVPADLMEQDAAARQAWVDTHSPFLLRFGGTPVKSIKDPASTILVHQKPETAVDGVLGAAYADGHAELLNPEALAEKLK